ncbi:hypothetical protein [Segetibacter aerophilus]|uniref:hypothetical protein n=1 Tax=Segetibacter aerophilus TaxID=670293 RepID=UPI0011BE2C85|nr:hypothetical protein [Segetibacter aerophilus]
MFRNAIASLGTQPADVSYARTVVKLFLSLVLRNLLSCFHVHELPTIKNEGIRDDLRKKALRKLPVQALRNEMLLSRFGCIVSL